MNKSAAVDKEGRVKKTAKSSAGPAFVPMEKASDMAQVLDLSPLQEKERIKQRAKKNAKAPYKEDKRQSQELQVSEQINPAPVQMTQMMIPSSVQMTNMMIPSPSLPETIPKQDPFSLSQQQKAIPSPSVPKLSNTDLLLKKKAVQKSPYIDSGMRETHIAEMREYQSRIVDLAQSQAKGQPVPQNLDLDGVLEKDRRLSLQATNAPTMTDIAKLKPTSMNIRSLKPYLKPKCGLPLFTGKDILAQTVTNQRLGSLSFAGLDLLTDLFFKILLDHNVMLPHLTRFIGSGAVHVSDKGIRWLVQLTGKLQEVKFTGCKKITSCGLALLLHSQTSIEDIDLCLSGVTMVPPIWGKPDSHVKLKLDGCPLICPSLTKFVDHYIPNQDQYQVNEKDILPLKQRKVVILSGNDCDFNLGKYIKGESGTFQPWPVTVCTNVPFGENYIFNLYEINRKQVVMDLFISEGSIVLIPFFLDQCDKEHFKSMATKLAKRITNVVAKVEHTLPVLVGLHSNKMKQDEAMTLIKDMQCEVKNAVWKKADALERRFKVMTKRKWIVDNYDMEGLLYTSQAACVVDRIQKVPIFWEVINIDKRIDPSTSFKDALFAAENFVWMSYTTPETQEVENKLLEKVEWIQPFSEISKRADEVAMKNGFHLSHMTQPVVKKIAEELHRRGSVMYFSNLEEELFVTDTHWFVKLLAVIFRPPPPSDSLARQIRFIGTDQLMWTENALRKSLVSVSVTLAGKLTDEQQLLIIELLTSIGALIEVQVDRFTKDDPSTVFLVGDLLPDEPCIEREKLWEEEKPEFCVQRDKHYQFSPELPMSLLPSFMQRVAKIYKFTLLWKRGFLIRRGGVDLLMEQHEDEDGDPVIVFSCRTEFHRTESVRCRMQCLWSLLNTVTTIMDYTIKMIGAFANVIVPCPTCHSDKSNKKIVKDNDVYRYFVHISKASSGKGMKCNSRKYKCSELPNYSRNVEQIVGPENLYNLVPKHLASNLASTEDTLPDFNRCAMCEQCIVSGRKCASYGLPARTVRHCECKSVPLQHPCPSCGVCTKCTQFLMEMTFTLMPVSFGESKWRPHGRKGKKAEQDYVFNPKTSWLNIAKNNLYVVENIAFCPERFNFLDLRVYKGNQMSIGVLGEDMQPLIAYNLNRGCFGRDWVFNAARIASDEAWKGGVSPEVSVKVRHVTPKDNQPRQPGVSLVAVEFYKTGVKIWTEYLQDNGKLRLALHGEGPCNMIAQTPTLWMEPPLDADHPDLASGNFFVEIEKEDNKDKLVLASVTSVSVDGYTLETDEGEKTIPKNDPRLHPLGYSFASGTDRVLYLSPKLEKGSTVPVPTTTRTKRQRLGSKTAAMVPHVTCVESLNKMIDDKPYKALPMWFFTPEQRTGWEPSYCDLYNCTRWNTSPEALLCAFTRSRAKHEEELMDLIDAQHSGEPVAAMVLMPRKMDQEMLTFQSKPLFQLEKNYQVLHLCTSRQEKSNIHLINTKGLSLRKVHRTYVETMIATQTFLGLGSRMELPGYDKMLRMHKDFNLRDEQVVYYFNELLQSVTSVLMIYFVDCKLANRGENLMASEKLVHEFIEHKEKHLDWSGDATMCPAHILQMSYDPSQLENSPKLKPYIKFLKTVECNPSIEHLPQDFFNDLQGLEEFSANKSHLRELPQGLDKCAHLTKLEFSGTNLTTLPTDMKQLKGRLLHLDISMTNITAIPDVVFELVSLETLIADNLHLATLSESLKNLSNLLHLSLKGAVLSGLPKAITKLKKLERLELAGIPWLDVKPGHFITEQAFREYLRSINDENQQVLADIVPRFDKFVSVIDEKEAGKLNAELFRVFTRFGFHGDYQPVEDRAGGFPPEIFELENLTYLDLSYQGVVFVPEDISRLTKLKTLLLNDNPYLTLLPGAVGNLPLERLAIDDCPSLKTPPPEICSKGFMALMGYLRRLVAGSVACKRTKLMIVGLGGAGKTSLVKALLSGENKCHIESGEAITDGIDIHSWPLTMKNDTVTFSVWDFAGQTVYYNTHQFFLSNRAVYLLLWNIRLGYEHAGLDFWLSSISVHSPQAPIIIVGTHLDQVSNYVIPQIELKKRYPQIVGFHFISTWSGQGVRELQQKLFSVSIQQKYMGEKIPEVWLRFEEKILSHRTKSDVVSYSDVETIATDSGIFDSLETSQAVRFLHDLGTVQHFDNQFLRDKVVVNPQWIVDVMACVVSVKDSPIKEGKFKHSDIAKVWKDFPEEYHEWLLRLTEKFDLTFPLPEKALNLVPCLLPETEPEISWPSIDRKKGRRETKMEYKFEYLPVGLFNRGQVRLYEYSDSSFIWKRGSVLKKNGHVALIMQTRDNKLLLKCHGPRPENILFMIHEVFETLIQESFQGVQYDFRVPCGECMNMARDPYMFKGSTIRRATGLKTPFLQCVKNFHIISLTDLNGICPPDDSQDYDLHLKNTVQSLTDLRLDLSADIFISYCSEDLPNSDGKMVDPRDVRNSLVAAGYKCWFEENTEKDVLEERMLALRDAKIFLCMISNNYTKDPDCCNSFKFARTVLRKPMVIVLVGQRGVHTWKESALGMLISDEIYINMQRVEHNEEKTRELLKTLSDRLSASAKKQDNPPCFFSYCWKNSQRAIKLGLESVPGAVGFGDPRELKDYLQNNGINSWLDIERAGSVHGGLFEDIAEGLRDSQVIVACVSNEYASSLSCQMEFRFAARALNLPIIVAVVGTGQQWRATEVGMLSLDYDQINFQEPTKTGHEKLLQIVKTYVKPKAVDGRETKKKKDAENDDEKKASYQELFELAQRKFLRQISTYADIFELHPFPRLVIVDFAEPEEVEEEKPASGEKVEETAKLIEVAKPTAKPRIKDEVFGSNASIDRLSDRDIDHSRDHDKDDTSSSSRSQKKQRKRRQLTRRNLSSVAQILTFLRRKFCYKILCENEQGWHLVGDPIPVSSHFGESQLTHYAPYLARILAVIKHSSKIQLNCIGGEQGEAFIKWLEETTMSHTSSDFKAAFQTLRRDAGKADHGKSANNLARCLTTSGKVFWMCNSQHDKSRMTVLTDTAAPISVPADHSAAMENYMLNHMRPLKDWEQLAEKYLPKDVTYLSPDKSTEGKGETEKRDTQPEVTDKLQQGTATTGSGVPLQGKTTLGIEGKKEESATGSKKPGESVKGSRTSLQGKTERKRKETDLKAAAMGSSASIRSVTKTEHPVPSSSTEIKAEGKERPEFHARSKFKAAGYAAQASVKAANYQKGSKACVIL
ncbi:uncharacterized protein LOC135482601 [Lineus longissimus]|uniref:uncharacterized protein LOC135482601 n=1 Tax=Lineus longissimus TaxID=88925 RepID=UPI002B4ED48B